jgi:hypothetical protein
MSNGNLWTSASRAGDIKTIRQTEAAREKIETIRLVPQPMP